MANLRSRIQCIINDQPLPEGLRVIARITKSLTPELNNAYVSVFNCSPESRVAIENAANAGATIVVKAGNSEILQTVVKTNITFASTTHDQSSGNVVTTVETRDGKEGREIFPDQNFPKGVTVVDIILTLLNLIPTIDSTQIKAEIAKGTFDNATLYTFKNGYATTGNVIDALNTIFVGAGRFRWTIQDDTILVLPPNGLLPNPPILLNRHTSLIGVPKVTSKGLEGQAIFNTLITPGAATVVESERLNLRFQGRVEKVQHAIDNNGPDWISSFELTNVNSPTFADIDYLLVSEP